MTKKIKIEDITPEMLEAAQGIVRMIIRWQSEPARPAIGYRVLAAILALDPKSRTNVSVKIRLDAGLRDGLHAGLYAGLYAGLDAGLRDGLDAGLRDGLRDGLDAGLRDGLHAGLRDGLDAGLYAGLQKNSKTAPIKFLYCGIFWGWWLARYLIAAQWGCPLDWKKLGLLYAFVRFCPLIGIVEIEDGKARLVVLPKPPRVRLVERGITSGKIPLPLFELHGDGEPSAEYPAINLNLYHWHNVRIPERMGKVPSSEWKPEWIFDENNQEVRRILLENIPSEKVGEVLQLKSLSKWKSARSEYELVEAGNNPYPSRYRALRFKCPTTDRPYLVRVHPDTETAEAAIVALNRGAHPDSFAWEA
jgi:hypothetical protein